MTYERLGEWRAILVATNWIIKSLERSNRSWCSRRIRTYNNQFLKLRLFQLS